MSSQKLHHDVPGLLLLGTQVGGMSHGCWATELVQAMHEWASMNRGQICHAGQAVCCRCPERAELLVLLADLAHHLRVFDAQSYAQVRGQTQGQIQQMSVPGPFLPFC